MGRPSGRFSGKVALVTGAGSGIGRAAAERLASEGARIACVDVDPAGCQATSEAITKDGGEAVALRCDVSDAEAVRACVAAAVDRFGQLDVACNSAGLGSFHRCEELSREEWDRIISVNLTGTFLVSQAALPHLLAERGSIVNVASLAGLIGQAYCAAYCASKFGVVGLTKAMAIEFVKQGLRVNCVCPGGVATPILGTFQPPEGADVRLLGRLSLTGRLIDAAEIAEAIAYLASDAASSLNGVALPMDHGVAAG